MPLRSVASIHRRKVKVQRLRELHEQTLYSVPAPSGLRRPPVRYNLSCVFSG